MRKGRVIVAVLLVPMLVIASVIAIGSLSTEKEIAGFAAKVRDSAWTHRGDGALNETGLSSLPVPVQRYFQFVFRHPPSQAFSYVELKMEGSFRRPLREDFAPMTASQTVAVTVPALLFAGTTPIIPGVWARAYDAFADGKMTMKAKIMSIITVINEPESQMLNRISLRRWLLESPTYPAALLPGGPVHWEVVDARRARATVSAQGMSASLVATFRDDGSLESFHSEQDGDLTTPYHGSGEHVTRSDYRLVNGMMIPFAFSIARAAGGKLYPFWFGRIKDIAFYP